MFLKTQMLLIIVDDALMPYIFKVFGYKLRSKTKSKKKIEIQNLSYGILSKLIS